VLSIIAAILRLAGLAAVIIGVIAAVYGWGRPVPDALRLAVGGAAAIAGVLLMAAGEALGVLVAIEENTRKTTDLVSGKTAPR
jgi:hypothetical protein